MKHIFKLALVAFVTTVYSCNSASKKQTVDSVAKKPNSQPSVVQSENPESVEEQPIDTKLIFPKFIVKLHNFGLFGGHGVDGITDSSQVIINTDKIKNWSLTAKADTIGLQAYDFYNIMELIPEDKTDKFKISYRYNVEIYEPINNGLRLSMLSDYKPLNDSLNYFFKVPESVSNYSDLDEAIKKVSDVKRKLKLKDTVLKTNGGQELGLKGLTVSYKNKACEIAAEPCIYLKVERFNNGNKLVDTKFLTIKLIVGEEAE